MNLAGRLLKIESQIKHYYKSIAEYKNISQIKKIMEQSQAQKMASTINIVVAFCHPDLIS